MRKYPKITVIIPVYNVETYLSRCLESVVNQTLRDIEIICVNDGTKDQSVEIVNEYMKKDKRIQLLEKENGGLASARNFGLKSATGDMILFLDSDDYLELNACERIYEEHLNKNADIIVFGSTPFPEIPEPDEWVKWKLKSRNKYYANFCPAALFDEPTGTPFAWNRAFSREFLTQNHLTFPEEVLFGEDMVFILKAAPQARSIQFIEDNLHFYQCFRQGSLMQCYGGNNDKKLAQHIKNVKNISQYWREKGFLNKWGKEYFEWMIEFIVPDLIQFHPHNQKELARKFLQDIRECGLLEYKKKARFETWEKYRKLEKMAK